MDLEANPERIVEPDVAARSAAHYWQKAGCNEAADAGDITRTRRLVNGPKMVGFEKVRAYYAKALEVLPEASPEREVLRVFLRAQDGTNVVWDGKTAVYGGVRISVYPDGVLRLERTS